MRTAAMPTTTVIAPGMLMKKEDSSGAGVAADADLIGVDLAGVVLGFGVSGIGAGVAVGLAAAAAAAFWAATSAVNRFTSSFAGHKVPASLMAAFAASKSLASSFCFAVFVNS